MDTPFKTRIACNNMDHIRISDILHSVIFGKHKHCKITKSNDKIMPLQCWS